MFTSGGWESNPRRAFFPAGDGYVLKAQTQNEASTLESLSRERSLRPFAPQFMGCVEREGRTFIKMQDVLLSMTEPARVGGGCAFL